ncbi:MAG: tape measure protein, partial [Candidatus Thiodiazotropha taylori]|nr:tape measure protein [Candidatus Thiodiazotropha taylori]MCW4327691.1 tape measure protein [Candidatus Thiodiazotropha taylori]
MADKNQISLKIKTIVEGLKEIDKLASEIDELGGRAGDTGKEAQTLNAEFQKLQKQQNTITQLEQLNSKISKTARDLETARTKATEFGRAMATAEKPTKALANEFERARSRVRQLKEMQAAQLSTLKSYSNRAKAAGVDTKRLTAEQVRLAGSLSKIKSKITGVSSELAKTRNSYRAAAKEAKSYGTAVDKAGKFSGMLGRLLPVAALASAVKWFKDAAVGAESLKKGFEVVSGSAESAGKEMDYLRKTASRLGLPLREAGKAYLSLTAAAKGTRLEGQASRKIFEAVSLAMGKLGRSSAETEGALLAIQQMISKGKVSAEELRGQLGERLPGAFQAAARAMGVTTAELDKMLKSGEVIAEDLLPKLAQELNGLYDDGSKIDTFGASWNRLKNSISGAFSAINESSGAMNVLGGALEGLGSAVTLVSVGFVTLTEKIKGASTMARAFWDAATNKDVTLTDALKRTKAAWEEIEKAIRNAADTAFNADSNLSKLGNTTKETGIKVIQLGDAASKTAGDVKKLDDNQKDATNTTIENKEASNDLTVQMYDLAKSYREGKITSQDFYRSMQKLSAVAAAQRAAAAQVAAGNREIASSAQSAASAVVQGEQRAAAARSQGMQSFQNFWQNVRNTYHSISASIGAQYDEMIAR